MYDGIRENSYYFIKDNSHSTIKGKDKMLIEEAKRILGIANIKNLCRKEIDTAYRRQCRMYHPDSVHCKQASGKKMNELSEARNVLIHSLHNDVQEHSIHTLWNEEKHEWFEFGSSIGEDIKEFPFGDLVKRLIQSKVVDAMLTQAQRTFVYTKEYGSTQKNKSH